MDSISAFDFNNEGDCILANESLKSKISNDLSISQNFTFSYMDLMMLQTCCDMLFNDVQMTEEQLAQLKRCDDSKSSSIKPFIDIIDMNRADEDQVNSIKPKSAVVIGIEGNF